MLPPVVVSNHPFCYRQQSLKQVTFGPGPDLSPLGDPAAKGVYFVNGRSSGVLTAYHVGTKQTVDVVSELATQPLLSQSGRQLAYVTAPEPGREELWFTDVDGGNARKVQSSNVSLETLAWSVDGSQFLFSEDKCMSGLGDKADCLVAPAHLSPS